MAGASIPHTKDIWCRDYMPVQVGEGEFRQFIYAPDYLRGCEQLITPAAACRLKTMADYRQVPLVLDGGNVVSARTRVILTDKVFYENPGQKETEVRRLLEKTFRAECILIPRPPGDPIGHADGVVRFIDERNVLVNGYTAVDKAYGRCLRSALKKHRLGCEEIPYFFEDRTTDGIPSAVGCYINYLRTERLIVLPVFGATRDKTALRTLESLFPGTRVVPLRCEGLARKGGCLNCVSWTIRSAFLK